MGSVTSEENPVSFVTEEEEEPLVASGLPPQETSATAEIRTYTARISADTFFIFFPPCLILFSL